MQLSYWEQNAFFADIDFTIVGSGIVGLSAAIELKNKFPKAKVLVVERGVLPLGASSKNAGFACFGSASEILDDLSIMTEEEVYELVEKRWKGLQNLSSLLGEKGIGLQNFGGYELFTQNDAVLFEDCKNNIDQLNRLLSPIFGKDVFSVNNQLIEKFGFNGVENIIQNPLEAQIDTGVMITNLIRLAHKKDITILNGVEVKSFENKAESVVVNTNLAAFNTGKLIVATNGFAKQILPDFDVEPARAQVLVTEPIPNLKVKGTFHYDKGYYYFRNIGNRILFGGGRNLAFEEENTSKMELTDVIQNQLDKLLKEVIVPNEKEVKVDMRWTGIMGVGKKKTTLVKEVESNVYCAVRMGGMGVAIGSLIGKEVTEFFE